MTHYLCFSQASFKKVEKNDNKNQLSYHPVAIIERPFPSRAKFRLSPCTKYKNSYLTIFLSY
jgi:hypothetical protein